MLIRFFCKKEYAGQFVSGKIYCNSLGYFRTYHSRLPVSGAEAIKDKCTDALEGSSQILRNYFPYSDSFESEFLEHLNCDPHIVFSEYAKSHICCFSNINNSFSSEMQQFGNWCVAIYNFKIFETKIRAAIESLNGLYYLHGSVEYYSPSINGENLKLKNELVLSVDGSRVLFDESKRNTFLYRDTFWKISNYKEQPEWRLLLYKENWNTDAFILETENLTDCCKIFNTSDAFNEIKKIKNAYKLCDAVPLHISGNINRKNLNRKIIEKDPWGQIHFILGSEKMSANIFPEKSKLKVKQVQEPERATIRGFL